MLALYAGAFFWCMAYDTIYALQDREDDALVGIKSSALRLGDNVKAGVGLFYAAAIACFGNRMPCSGKPRVSDTPSWGNHLRWPRCWTGSDASPVSLVRS